MRFKVQPAARSGASGGFGFVVLVDAWQLWRQRCAFGLLTGRRVGYWCGRQMLEFQFDGCDVGIYGLVEQAGLGLIELLAAPAELPAL